MFSCSSYNPILKNYNPINIIYSQEIKISWTNRNKLYTLRSVTFNFSQLQNCTYKVINRNIKIIKVTYNYFTQLMNRKEDVSYSSICHVLLILEDKIKRRLNLNRLESNYKYLFTTWCPLKIDDTSIVLKVYG